MMSDAFFSFPFLFILLAGPPFASTLATFITIYQAGIGTFWRMGVFFLIIFYIIFMSSIACR